MKGLQRDEALKVVPLAPPEPANDTKPIPAQPKKWRRVTINRKTLACALIAELIIIGAILVVNWSIAERGDTGEPLCSENRGSGSPPWPVRWPWRRASWFGPDWSILGAVHRRRAVRALMLLGALLSVLVTTKSMSIVYEQLFASRLREVVAATMALDKAQADKATLEAKRKGPAADDADRKARLARFDSELAGLRDTLKQFGTPPKPVTKCGDRPTIAMGRSSASASLRRHLRGPARPCSRNIVKAQAERDEAGCGASAWPSRSSRPRDPDRAGGRSRDGGKQPANGKGCGEPNAFLRGDDLSQVAP